MPTTTRCWPIREVEAVIIATADAFHVPAAIAALEAGKHVLCEKPVGVDGRGGRGARRRRRREPG